jgi:peptidoglycan/xylan/chitin deacetylase (PgdA/CDA1 family)
MTAGRAAPTAPPQPEDPPPMLARHLASARQVLTVGTDLVLQRYPRALYRREAPARELPPVFCFHSAAPEPFAAVLGFLARNRYRTLIADELGDLMTGDARDPGARSVLLTFDDGVREVWSIVHPLLKRHGLRATCFVVPGRIEDAAAVRPTLEDVWQGRASLAEVVTGDGPPLATWPEIAAMAASGVIDIQCHSFDHRLVFTSPRIMGFVSPQALATFHPFEFAMFEEQRPPLGSPIYTSAPRLGAHRAFRPDPKIAAICVAHVEQEGGAAFFARPDWRRRLLARVREQRRSPPAESYESEAERRQAIATDLRRARAAIEARLPGHRVRHLAFPWGEGSAAAVDAARESGYEACFWGKVDGRLTNQAGGDPLRIARIGEDFVRSLPGDGRIPLRRVVAGKLERRLRHGAPYLSH